MENLAEFFRESDTSHGVVYPKHYVIATFPQYAVAQSAHQSLGNTGVPQDEITLATGAKVPCFFNFREDAGLWGIVMRPISRFFGTEATSADHDIERAKDGAGFIAVHSRTEKDTQRIPKRITPFRTQFDGVVPAWRNTESGLGRAGTQFE
ncbi:MAG: hypothetical protein ABIR70_21665 [Bryobacteraceae bacterium]